MGGSPFLLNEDGKRLINVAISRAQARLVLTLSPGDRKQPTLNQIANFLAVGDNSTSAMPISHYVDQIDFPDCAVGALVHFKSIVGLVTRADRDYFYVADHSTGAERRFEIARVIANFSSGTVPMESRTRRPTLEMKRKQDDIQRRISTLQNHLDECSRFTESMMRKAEEELKKEKSIHRKH
jgi:hypothetical protein